MTPKNYRPISLTSIFCKLMEKIILRRLTYHLDTRNLLPKEQYGFRKGHKFQEEMEQCVKVRLVRVFTREILWEIGLRSWHGGILSGEVVPGDGNHRGSPGEVESQSDHAGPERSGLQSSCADCGHQWETVGVKQATESPGKRTQVRAVESRETVEDQQLRGSCEQRLKLEFFWGLEPPLQHGQQPRQAEVTVQVQYHGSPASLQTACHQVQHQLGLAAASLPSHLHHSSGPQVAQRPQLQATWLLAQAGQHLPHNSATNSHQEQILRSLTGGSNLYQGQPIWFDDSLALDDIGQSVVIWVDGLQSQMVVWGLKLENNLSESGLNYTSIIICDFFEGWIAQWFIREYFESLQNCMLTSPLNDAREELTLGQNSPNCIQCPVYKILCGLSWVEFKVASWKPKYV
ncbi:hypothetical protein LAZ67_7003628 [Cordylochernes scorpioides]|uniref:Reverse transcriptase domain-containing protein n=1 Tax=Cordylochernes scorpioides TaxID=51811 RepID=A0ABY6KP42_9ARAC|nr:hypothetical protein LAZ67_7003628 [Cordylochernes scorpioides]